MTVQDIDVDHNIWGKSVPYLKGNTTRKKPIPVVSHMVQVPEDLLKIHKDIYLREDIFFVNSTPLFITLIRKI